MWVTNCFAILNKAQLIFKKSHIAFIFIILFSSSAFAMPKNFEMWFLSPQEVAWLQDQLNKQDSIQYSKRIAANCEKMGDYCFDPQIGLYKPSEKPEEESTQIENALIEQKEEYKFLEQPSSIDRQMINCEKSTIFDMFCGTAKANSIKKKTKAKLEIWIDISSTLKQSDYPGVLKTGCARASLISRLEGKSCKRGEKLELKVFTENLKSIHELDNLDRVCTNYGLNKAKNIVRDIKASDANNLIVITDIFEGQESVIQDFIFGEGGRRGRERGIEKKLRKEDMLKLVKHLTKLCK